MGSNNNSKMVSLNKQSKKNQKAYYDRQRGSWGGVNPVTKVVPSKKVYNRPREKRGLPRNLEQNNRD